MMMQTINWFHNLFCCVFLYIIAQWVCCCILIGGGQLGELTEEKKQFHKTEITHFTEIHSKIISFGRTHTFKLQHLLSQNSREEKSETKTNSQNSGPSQIVPDVKEMVSKLGDLSVSESKKSNLNINNNNPTAEDDEC